MHLNIFNFILYLLIWERKGGWSKREKNMNLLYNLHIHWSLLVSALTGDGTHNLGVSGPCSKQLHYLSGPWNFHAIVFQISCVKLLFPHVVLFLRSQFLNIKFVSDYKRISGLDMIIKYNVWSWIEMGVAIKDIIGTIQKYEYELHIR